MPASNPIDILLAHDSWATGQLLAACRPLSHEQFHQRFEMGPGSVHDTLSHVIGAKQRWADVLAGRTPRRGAFPPFPERTVEALATFHDEVAGDFAAQALAQPLDRIVQLVRDNGQVLTHTRGSVLTHVTTHGMHHRAQCLNMLRHLGVKTLPPSSVVEWVRLVDAPQ